MLTFSIKNLNLVHEVPSTSLHTTIHDFSNLGKLPTLSNVADLSSHFPQLPRATTTFGSSISIKEFVPPPSLTLTQAPTNSTALSQATTHTAKVISTRPEPYENPYARAFIDGFLFKPAEEVASFFNIKNRRDPLNYESKEITEAVRENIGQALDHIANFSFSPKNGSNPLNYGSDPYALYSAGTLMVLGSILSPSPTGKLNLAKQIKNAPSAIDPQYQPARTGGGLTSPRNNFISHSDTTTADGLPPLNSLSSTGRGTTHTASDFSASNRIAAPSDLTGTNFKATTNLPTNKSPTRTFDYSHLQGRGRYIDPHETVNAHGTLDTFKNHVTNIYVTNPRADAHHLLNVVGEDAAKKIDTAIRNDPNFKPNLSNEEISKIVSPHIDKALREAGWNLRFIQEAPISFVDTNGNRTPIKKGWHPAGQNGNPNSRDLTFNEVINKMASLKFEGLKNSQIKLEVRINGNTEAVPVEFIVKSHLDNLISSGQFSAAELKQFYSQSGLSAIDSGNAIYNRLTHLAKYENLPSVRGSNYTLYRNNNEITLDFSGSGLALTNQSTTIAQNTRNVNNYLSNSFKNDPQYKEGGWGINTKVPDLQNIDGSNVLLKQKPSDGLTKMEINEKDRNSTFYYSDRESDAYERAIRYLNESKGLTIVEDKSNLWKTEDGMFVHLDRSSMRFDPESSVVVSWPNPIIISKEQPF